MSIGQPSLGIVLFNRASQAREHAARTGRRRDLDIAVAISRQAVSVIDAGYRATALAGLCGALTERSAHLGGIDDLVEAETVGRQAVVAGGGADAWLNVAAALALRFRWTGLRQDANAAVDAGRAALEAIPADAPDRSSSLSNQALLLTDLHRRFGASLEDAIAVHEQAIATAQDSSQRRRALSNLAAALPEEDRAVEAASEALSLTPPDHPERVATLANLGTALLAQQRLDEAIGVLNAAAQAATVGSATRSVVFAALGIARFNRFLRNNAFADVDGAAAATAEAAHTAQSSDRPRHLSHLGTVLRARFDVSGDPRDLKRAVLVGEHAIAGMPTDHPELAGYLVNLAGSALLLLEHDPDGTDGTEVERVARAAVAAAVASPVRAAAQSQLAQVLRLRGKIHEAIVVARASVALAPPGHPVRARYLSNLAALIEFVNGGEDPAPLWAEAGRSPGASADVRLAALSALAGRTATTGGPAAARDLYREAVSVLLPSLVWRGINPADRRRLLRSHADLLAGDAAGCAIADASADAAVEVLELGRGVLWAQLLDDRRALDDVSAADSDLAERLALVRAGLDVDVA